MLEIKDIAIVILNWNGKSLLEQFLPSVVRHSEDAKIYVADNASTDNSMTFVETHYPNITIIQNTENGGYAKGYNDALQHVEEPVLCLLNNDVEVTEHWLKAILNEFNTTPETAIIQPKLLDFKKRSYFEYAGAAGGFIDKYGYPYCRGRIFNTIEEDRGQYNDTTSILWASGACFFIKNTIFKKLNAFDANYFAHMEEIDLCWRAFNLGYKITYVGASKVFHLGGGTLQNNNPKKTYLNFRNSLFTLVKNTNRNLLGRIFTRLVLDGIAGLRFLTLLKPMHCLAVLHSHIAFYIAIPRLLKQREKLSHLKGYYQRKSVVWDYFFKKKHLY